jgi:hypothetical protein
MTVGVQWPAEPGDLGDVGSGELRASIVTPGDWAELDLDPTTRHTSIRRVVRAAVRRKTVRQPDAVRLIRCLEQIAARAHGNGAFYCASQVVADDPTRDPLVANVMMHLVACDLPGWSGATPPRVCGWLSECLSRDNEGSYDVVQLPFVGPALRHEVMAVGILVQYFVPLPVPGSTAIVVLTFTCPCPPYVPFARRLFDVMATSLSLDLA